MYAFLGPESLLRERGTSPLTVALCLLIPVDYLVPWNCEFNTIEELTPQELVSQSGESAPSAPIQESYSAHLFLNTYQNLSTW